MNGDRMYHLIKRLLVKKKKKKKEKQEVENMTPRFMVVSHQLDHFLQGKQHLK